MDKYNLLGIVLILVGVPVLIFFNWLFGAVAIAGGFILFLAFKKRPVTQPETQKPNESAS